MKVLKSLGMVVSVVLSGIGTFSLANNLAVRELFGTHIEIGLGESKTLSDAEVKLSNVLEVQKELKNQLSFPLIDQLDVATNETMRGIVLKNYLSSSQSLLRVSSSVLESEQALITTFQTAGKSCEAPITDLNKDFTRAVQEYDYPLASSLSQQIAKLRACAAENAVYYKEHLGYRDGVNALQTVLQKRVEYVEEHQEAIVKYYEILKPQLLKELYAISQTLEGNF
jgi:hypothetical protein